jgi:hypothetical protein
MNTDFPSELELFKYIRQHYPDLDEMLRHPIEPTLLGIFTTIARYFSLPDPRPSDPVVGTAELMLAKIKQLEDDKK